MIAASVVLASTPAFAGEAFNVSGVGKGKTTRTVVETIAEGHVLIGLNGQYETYEAANPSSPFKGMTGQCWGAVEVKPPSASGGGNCAFTTPSGDKHFNRYVVKGVTKDGALVGTWSVIGGTGKFEGAAGGGTFQSQTDEESGTFTNTVEGAIVTK